jgi:hypothetical protein
MDHPSPTCDNSAGTCQPTSVTHLDKGKNLVLFNPGAWTIEMWWLLVWEEMEIDYMIHLKME